MMRKSLLCVLVLTIGVTLAVLGAASADDETDAVARAKANHATSPSAETLDAVEAAVREHESSTRSVRADLKTTKGAVSESEGNDTAMTADLIQYGQHPAGEYGVGDISPAGDIDYWYVLATMSLNDLVFAYVDTSPTTTGTDSQLNLISNDGVTVVEFDDDDGPGLSSCIGGYVVAEVGNYYYRINEYGDNGEITPYNLHQTVCAQGNSQNESESNDTSGTANPITACYVVGSASGADVDYFSFNATAGDLVALVVDDDPDKDTDLLDTEIDILDTDGSTVLAPGDDRDGNDDNCAGAVAIAADGTYFVRIGDGGSGGADTDYRFTVLRHGGFIPVELMRLTVE